MVELGAHSFLGNGLWRMLSRRHYVHSNEPVGLHLDLHCNVIFLKFMMEINWK